MTYTLTINAETVAKIRAAYEAGELQHQKAEASRSISRYRSDLGPCAIGVIIEDDFASAADSGSLGGMYGVRGLSQQDGVNVITPPGAHYGDTITLLQNVQSAHDQKNWGAFEKHLAKLEELVA